MYTNTLIDRRVAQLTEFGLVFNRRFDAGSARALAKIADMSDQGKPAEQILRFASSACYALAAEIAPLRSDECRRLIKAAPYVAPIVTAQMAEVEQLLQAKDFFRAIEGCRMIRDELQDTQVNNLLTHLNQKDAAEKARRAAQREAQREQRSRNIVNVS